MWTVIIILSIPLSDSPPQESCVKLIYNTYGDGMINLPNFVTPAEQDVVIQFLREELFIDAVEFMNKATDPQRFFRQNDRAYGKVYAEFVLAHNYDAMKIMWMHGANETHNRDNEGILECLGNYATNTHIAAPGFNNDALLNAFGNTEIFYKTTGGLEQEKYYRYTRDLIYIVKQVNAELSFAMRSAKNPPGVVERITDFGNKFIPFVAQRIEQLRDMNIAPLQGQSGWQNGVEATLEDFESHAETFNEIKSASSGAPVLN